MVYKLTRQINCPVSVQHLYENEQFLNNVASGACSCFKLLIGRCRQNVATG